MTTCQLIVDSPVDELTLVGDDIALHAVYFAEHRHAPVRDRLGAPVRRGEAPGVLTAAADQLAEYFAGERTDFELPLAPAGTTFQRRVWDGLHAIPYGRTRSYGELATALGVTGAARAVGMANGRNPLSIVVPCHRVIGADGSLSGYGGGVQRKQALLDLERRVAGLSLW
ncbi:MAG: methylated-DNA--[protein]-cysteine S-methyltransferase [Ornithinimicrobium sp.]|uniref:methylated-DNA--[protein]-cysteine S-methyltransferase n=1 Tax=Ornithinimicrobium sp. TaxID=1977084 RepID=UPI003D9B804F